MRLYRTRIWLLCTVGTATLSACQAHAADLELPLLWTTDLKTFTESGPSVADLNGDGRDEVLVCGREEMIAIDGQGQELWRWRTKIRFLTYPTTYHPEKGETLIYGACYSGQFTCLDESGNVVWQRQLNGPSTWSAAAVCDLDGDGVMEVVQTDEPGTIWAFDARTGDVRWKAQVKGMPVSPAVGDIDKDGKAEISVVTGEGSLVLIGYDGTVRWVREIGGISQTWGTNAPVMFTTGAGEGRIVAATNDGHVFCYDPAGNLLWHHPVRGPVAATISVGDIDENGVADVFLITQTGVIYRYSEDGAPLWEINTQKRCLAAGAILDINADGRLEFALCSQPGQLLILNDEGKIIYEKQLDHRTINVTPTFGELIPESPGLEMVITGGEAGLVRCFSTQATSEAKSQWTAYRCDEGKTGTRFGSSTAEVIRMVPVNLAWDQVFTGESIRFVITDPKPGSEPLTATVTCVRPDGARQADTTKVIGKGTELRMPVEVMESGDYVFEWTLTRGNGERVLTGSRKVGLRPFVNDRALALRALAALRDTADAVQDTLPLSSSALRKEAILLEHDADAAASLQEVAIADASRREGALKATAVIVVRSRQAIRVADAVVQAAQLGPQTSLVAFVGRTWENRGVDRQVPSRAENPLKLGRTLVPNEHDPIPLCLFNVTDRNINARILVDIGEGGPTLTLHRAVDVISSLGEASWDPLPELDESMTIVIPPLSTREVWVDVFAKDVAAGQHKVTIHAQALNGAGVVAPKSPQRIIPPEVTVELSLDVLPFEMAPSSAMRLCAWANIAEQREARVRDMIDHGNNVFIIYHGLPQYDANGTLTDVDFSGLAASLEVFFGKDVFLLIQGPPALRPGIGTPEYARDLKAYVDRLVPFMKSKGFDTDHFALYPHDEPGGHGWHAVDLVVAFGKALHAANPDVLLYVNGGGEVPMFEAMAPYVDVWCPPLNMPAEDSDAMRIIRNSGKHIWTYDCGYGYAYPTGPNIKNVNIIAQYRVAALYMFRHGATGMGYWCYNISNDPWGRIQMEYPLVYRDKRSPSRAGDGRPCAKASRTVASSPHCATDSRTLHST